VTRDSPFPMNERTCLIVQILTSALDSRSFYKLYDLPTSFIQSKTRKVFIIKTLALNHICVNGSYCVLYMQYTKH
jgi:hypothetical protein